MQSVVGGKVAIGGGVAVAVIAMFSLTLGTTLDYRSQASTGTQGDSMSPTWGPTSDGTTIYDANDGNGPRTINGWVVATLADSDQTPPTVSANTQLVRLTRLDFATPSNTAFVYLNGMQDFGGSGAINVPAGWFGMPTSGDGSVDSSYHLLGGSSYSGYRFLAHQRNANNGDVGFIMSPPDDTSPYAHWMNSYHAYKDLIATQGCSGGNTVTIGTSTVNTLNVGDPVWVHGANANNGVFTLTAASSSSISYVTPCANVSPTSSAGYVSFTSTGGDAVRCGAASKGAACTDPSYATGMMWKASPKMQNMKPIVYGQDGTGTGPDGSGTWCYFMSYNSWQFLHRIACADLKGPESWVHAKGWTDPANWGHYNSPGPVPNSLCNGLLDACWDVDPTNSTAVTGVAIDTGQNQGPIIYKSGTYYMLLTIYGGHGGYTVDAIGLNTAPIPWGPWTMSAQYPVPGGNQNAMGFPVFLFPFILTQSSTQFTVPMLADNNITATGHDGAGNPVFNLMTIVHH